jgi:hypothetical protein
LNYVQGVTYFTGTQEGQPVSFTNMFLNITAHTPWINSVRRKSEKRLHREWGLNNRVVESNDVCKSQNDTKTNTNNEGDDNQNGLNSRSSGFSDNKPDE